MEVFDAIDEDESGQVSVDEFSRLLFNLDPDLERSDIVITVQKTGCPGGLEMERKHFYKWVGSVFGEFEDSAFKAAMEVFLKDLHQPWHTNPLTPLREEWANRVFATFDADQSGSMDEEPPPPAHPSAVLETRS